MSADPPDEALQRLNYFNGQRLVAGDFRAEQGHHVGMRRVLNRSLYSPGIVVGLEVVPASTESNAAEDKHRVIVKRGLAFDHLGREIFLPVDLKVQVMGAPSTTAGLVLGNLLAVSYRESRRFPVRDGCIVGARCQSSGGELSWGAPTRIVADAVFEFLDSWPGDETGKIVLAQLELSSTCEVVRASPGVRRYAVPAKPQTTRPLSMEGEKDVNSSNPKVLIFHIDGGYPESAKLYLRGRSFPSLYYTELGKHSHSFSAPSINVIMDHNHTLGGAMKTKVDGAHRHSFYWDDGDDGAFDLNDASIDDWVIKDQHDPLNPIIVSGEHQHELEPINLTPLVHTATIPITGAVAQAPGSITIDARTAGAALGTIRELRIFLDGHPVTNAICDQLEAIPGQAGRWKVPDPGNPTEVSLNGTSLSQGLGTGEIDLLRLGLELGLGEHKLEFRVHDAASGGTLQYNLYVN